MTTSQDFPMAIDAAVYVRKLWSDTWQAQPYLVPNMVTVALMPTISSATFTWRYGRIARAGEAAFGQVGPQPDGLADWYVQVRISSPDPVNAPDDAVIFTGRFGDEVDAPGGTRPLVGTTGQQTLTAYGLETMLSQACVTGSYALINDSVQNIDTCLHFNLRHRNGVALSGNRSTAKYADANGNQSYVFSDDGEIWTARDVAEYLIVRFGPAGPGSPTFSLLATPELANLDVYKDIWPCPDDVARGLSALIRRQRGHTWSVWGGQANPSIEVRSVFEDNVAAGGVTIVGNSTVADLTPDAPGQALQSFQIRRSQNHVYDEIHVIGNPLWVCGTAALTKGWSDAAEDAYKAATDIQRADDAFRNVYQAFELDMSDGLPFIDAGVPTGTGIGCPAVNMDGTVDLSKTSPLYTFGRQLTRQTPLREGYQYDGGKEAVRFSGSTPPDVFLPPAVYVKFTFSGTDYRAPVHKMAATFGRTGGPSASVSVLDSKLGVLLQANPNHLFALNHWTGAADTATAPVFDYENLLATVALRADVCQRIVLNIGKVAPADSQAARRLVIEVPDAEYWVVLKDTIVGSDGTNYQRTPGNIVLRDDRGKLAIVAAMAQSWFGRTRRAVSCTWKRIAYDNLPGDLVGNVVLAGKTLASGSIISRVAWDFVAQTTTLDTDFGELDVLHASGQGVRGGLGGSPFADASGASPSMPNVPCRLKDSPLPNTGFWAQLTSPTLNGTNRWTYTFTEVAKTTAGYDGWTVLSGGRTGTAYNIIENGNAATGVQGNGVDVVNLTGTFVIKPLPTNKYAYIMPVPMANGNVEFWIVNYANGIDGGC